MNWRCVDSNGVPASLPPCFRNLNRAMFIGKDAPTVGADQTYQLWTLAGQRPIPRQSGGRRR
jgi:hypothetical protein